ncbi:MAG TPA: glycosyl hydrolase family 8 [Bryobacteraceae bacterium]|nr:glycosyl hydrolase family 8 [Bryobacteraceae bacterium]
MFTLLLAACAAGAGRRQTAPPRLEESWLAYQHRFLQSDGRVIDRRAQDISTSEGQAYAMLRAVWLDDRAAFDKAHTWALNNLNRGVRKDHLWAWKWGKDADGRWHALDPAFATDADQDAALALILASDVWREPGYLSEARAVLADLWKQAVIRVASRCYLLAGDSLCKGSDCRVNPSYYAPYAYRIFARHDKNHSWDQMAAASYPFLAEVSRLTATHLPPDWVQLDAGSGALSLGDDKSSAFSYDAFRTFWRVALDYELNHGPDAAAYLQKNLSWIIRRWTANGSIPAVIGASGAPRAEYQSYEMLAALLPAVSLSNPGVAAAMAGKLDSIYLKGLWGEDDAYYLQNWAWFGTALYQHYLGPLTRYATR